MTRPSTPHGWVLRIGGMATVVGSLLAMVGNLLHPMTPVGDPAGVGHAIHASHSWTIATRHRVAFRPSIPSSRAMALVQRGQGLAVAVEGVMH